MSSSRRNNENILGDTDKLMYEMGLVALGILLAAVLLYFYTGFSILSISYRCVFSKVTGLPCPGCGGTRAARALASMDVKNSLYYYPPLVYGIVVYVVFMTRCFFHKHFGFAKSRDGAIIKYLYILIGIIMLQWAVKLVCALFFGYYWV